MRFWRWLWPQWDFETDAEMLARWRYEDEQWAANREGEVDMQSILEPGGLAAYRERIAGQIIGLEGLLGGLDFEIEIEEYDDSTHPECVRGLRIARDRVQQFLDGARASKVRADR